MVIYFSATGNSKYIADMIAASLNDVAINSFEYIRGKKGSAFLDEERYVFVCPVYVSAPARHFESFLMASKFTPGTMAWFLVTGAGSIPASTLFFEKIAAKKGLRYMGGYHVQMPQDYLMFFKTKSADENQDIVKAADEVTAGLIKNIKDQVPFPSQGVKKCEYGCTQFIRNWYYHSFMKTKKFHTTDACIRCGLCEKICPLNNIRVNEDGVVWGDDCMHCTACINHCPKKAIEFGKKTVGKPRYICPPYQK